MATRHESSLKVIDDHFGEEEPRMRSVAPPLPTILAELSEGEKNNLLKKERKVLVEKLQASITEVYFLILYSFLIWLYV